MQPYYSDDAVTIYHGDCREVLSSVSGDVMVTDPPYSLSVDSDHENRRGKGTRRLDFFEGDRDWNEMTALVLQVVTKTTADPNIRSAYFWCGHRQFGPIVSAFEAQGWRTRFLVWSKLCPVPAPPGVGWNSGAELCVYAFRPGRLWNWATGEEPRSNVLVADSYRHGQPGKVDHPTQKPLILASVPIQSSCPEGGTVLDPFMGSGTTLRAAKDLGRKAIGIERVERYCEIAAKRMAQEVLDFGGVA